MNCEVCDQPADFQAYAAYEQLNSGVHPLVNRYPQPMIISCSQHLAVQLERDSLTPGTTNEWVITKIQH